MAEVVIVMRRRQARCFIGIPLAGSVPWGRGSAPGWCGVGGDVMGVGVKGGV